MNYFNETEKSLKRYLKSKVSITMATVVGFMIAGSVSFGADMSQEEFNKMQETSYGKQFTSGETTLVGVKANGNEISHEKYIVTVSSGAKLTIDKDSVISTNGTNKYALNITENSTVVNNGEIIFNPTGFSGKVAVQLNGGAATKEKPATLINNNKIIGQNWLGNTIEMSGNSTLINSGIITGNIVGSNYKGQAGTQVINLKKGSHIEGTIKLNGTGENLINIDGVKNENSETIDIQSKNVEVTINNSDVILTGNISNEEGTAISVNNKDGNNTIVNNATIVAETGIGVMNEGSDNSTAASDRLVSITNNGDITAKYYGIYNNGYFTKHNKIEITNTGNILVNDFVIDKETYDKPYYYATGIYQASGPYTKTAGIVRNDGGEVRVELTAEQYAELKAEYEKTQGNMYLNIHGIRIHEHSEGYNTGDIIVNAFGGNGVVLSAGDTGANAVEEFKDRYNYFENAGNIVVTGENGIGLALKNTTEAKMEAINDSTGVITVNGDNAIAVKVVGKNSNFTNEGALVLGKDGTNKKAIVVKNGGQATNNGTVKLERIEKEDATDEILDSIFDGEGITDNGIILDKNGKVIRMAGENLDGKVLTTKELNDIPNEALKVTDGKVATLTGNTTDIAKNKVINLGGGTFKVTGDSKIEDSQFNVVKGETSEGNINITNGADFILSNIRVNGSEVTSAVTIDDGASVTFGGNNTIVGNMTGAGNVNVVDGKTVFDGDFGVSNLTIGTTTKSTTNPEGYFTADSKFTIGTNIDANNGQMTIAIADDLSNVLVNSTANVTVDGNVGFDYSSLTKDTVVALSKGDVDHNLANAIVVNDKDSVYKVTIDDTDDTAKFKYNKTLLEDNGYAKELNDINNGFQVIQDKVSQLAGTTQERAELADKVYAGTIYAETMKMSYDNTKLVEDSILSLETETKAGEWTTNGKALYFKNEYDRKGILKDYSSESESTGLMATLEYGVNDTTSVGVAFAGVKQDLDTETGSADGDAFYLGTFANKVLANNRFTVGLGYQLDKFDVNEKIFGGNEKYDSNTFTAYLQAKHIFDLGDNVSFEPKAKLGYTYINQDEVKDGTYKVESQDMNVFDAELGFDLVKSVALKTGKLDVTFGASYVRAMGDVDDNYSARFYNSTAEGSSFDILGAELSEDTAKFDLGVEVSKDNGVFYNLGGTLRVGSDSTRNYGVKLGAGYKF